MNHGEEMSLEAFNLNLFEHLNAPIGANIYMVDFAIFIANDTLYLLIIFLLLSWFLGSRQSKELAFKAVLTTVIALTIGFLISSIFPHPRPFMIDAGRTLIYHAPNASFPSDHMLIFSSIALSYLFAKEKNIGIFLLLLAIEVAWSRVYLGVHFPLDMVGAFFVALFTNIIMQKIWIKHGANLIDLALKIYRFIFSKPLQKGWVK